MSKDVKTLRMLSFFLALSLLLIRLGYIIRNIALLYHLVDHVNRTKSYLLSGKMTKNTDGYLILEILLSPTYGVDERPRISTSTWS